MKFSFYGELECVFVKFPKYSVKNLLDINVKVGRKDIFKPTTGNESLREIGTEKGVNFTTSENLTVKSTMFPHCNIHKFTGTSANGKTHIQINRILIDRRRHSSVLDV
jgi:hypothetical protein